MRSGAILRLFRAATNCQASLIYALVLLRIACSAERPHEKLSLSATKLH
jgi:hypothetical protein